MATKKFNPRNYINFNAKLEALIPFVDANLPLLPIQETDWEEFKEVIENYADSISEFKASEVDAEVAKEVLRSARQHARTLAEFQMLRIEAEPEAARELKDSMAQRCDDLRRPSSNSEGRTFP